MEFESAAVVYEVDSRAEVTGHDDPDWAELTDARLLAVVLRDDLDRVQQDGAKAIVTAGERFSLCDEVPFRQEPSLAGCSAIALGGDLALTAAHCLPNGACSNLAFLSGYRTGGDGDPRRMAESSIYQCNDVIELELSTDGGDQHLDYAVVRLDRDVPSSVLLRVRHEALREGEKLQLLGTPLGVPAKVDVDGRVIDARGDMGDWFRGAIDSFAGNSGAPVFDADKRLVGFALAGAPDFVYDEDSRCQRNRTAKSNEGEGIAYLGPVARAICGAFQLQQLPCPFDGLLGRCGDGRCTGQEGLAWCSLDCGTESVETAPRDAVQAEEPNAGNCSHAASSRGNQILVALGVLGLLCRRTQRRRQHGDI